MENKKLIGGGDPNTDDHKELKPNGQQKDYVVLTEEERAKGFVRPVRTSYIHIGERPKYPLRDLTTEEQEIHKDSKYLKYEEYPKSESPLCGKFWTEKQLSSGCGYETVMNYEIAETYARNPAFYGSTYCVGCAFHYPLNQFRWSGSDQLVGS